MKNVVISFIGEDRPGLVDKLSQIIRQHQGNWQKSSMHQMSGYFAGIVEVLVQESHLPPLLEALEAEQALSIQVKVANGEANPNTETLTFEVTANDRHGIIQEISSVIHQQGGNLLKLVSTQESAAHFGHPLFKAKAIVALPKNNDGQQLLEALENLADDLIVDIET